MLGRGNCQAESSRSTVCAVIFESVDLETLCSVISYILRVCRSHPSIKVIRSRSRSQGQEGQTCVTVDSIAAGLHLTVGQCYWRCCL